MDTEHTQDLADEGLQQFRIERGAQVLGTDGLLGTVHQVVMDQVSGRLQSLVVRGEAGMDYELPASAIETSTGDEVRLNIGRADLANQPHLARPYAPEMYTPVESGQVMSPSAAADQAQDTPVLTNIEEDAVDVMAPASDIASGITPGLSAATPTPSDLRTAAPMGSDLDDLDDLDEVDEIEAVIIPGDQPGEADVFIASASDVPASGAMTPAETGPWTPTRGPQGADYRGPGGRSLVGVLAASGVLLVTGGAIATYLLARRNQERNSLSAQVRQQAGNVAGNAAALRDAVRARGSARWSDLSARARDQQRQVRDRMNLWVPAAASSLAALRDQAVERGSALGNTLGATVRQQTRQAANVTNRAIAPGGSARRTANRLGDRLSDRASDLRDQLTSMVSQAQKQVRPVATWRRMKWSARAGAAWQRLRDMPDQATGAWGRLAHRTTQGAQTATKTAAKTNTQAVKSAQKTVRRATANAGKQAKQAQANARRGVRRMRRRARWFRNGIIAGVIGGVLYAPRAGRDTRTTLAGWLRRIPGLDTFFAPATPRVGSPTSTRMTAGATGPHPQSTLPDARESWRGMDTTPSTLGTASEQSGGLPLTPDLTPEDMPGPAI